MKRTIHINDTEVSYTLRRNRRAKRMLLSVYGDGRVVVTTPHAINLASAERLLREKAVWLWKQIEHFRLNPVARVRRRGSWEHYVKHREAARVLVLARLYELNAHYGFSYNRVAIRNQKSCWGSCSAKKNLNFNYKLLFLFPDLRDYVIVHELCHLKELNHSHRFWQLVARTCPLYRIHKRELKSLEAGLQ